MRLGLENEVMRFKIDESSQIVKSLTKSLLLLLVMLWLTVVPNLASAAIGDDTATADVNCTVDSIAEWSGDFNDIQMPHVSDINTWTADANSKLLLFTNADIDITGDTTNAQLKLGGNDANNVLQTQYRLTFDGDGSTATGVASPTSWTDYDSFAGESVIHVYADGEVMVRLHVRARNVIGELPDPGSYSTTQTLTVAWP